MIESYLYCFLYSARYTYNSPLKVGWLKCILLEIGQTAPKFAKTNQHKQLIINASPSYWKKISFSNSWFTFESHSILSEKIYGNDKWFDRLRLRKMIRITIFFIRLGYPLLRVFHEKLKYPCSVYTQFAWKSIDNGNINWQFGLSYIKFAIVSSAH